MRVQKQATRFLAVFRVIVREFRGSILCRLRTGGSDGVRVCLLDEIVIVQFNYTVTRGKRGI